MDIGTRNRNGVIETGGSDFKILTPNEMIRNDLVNNTEIIDPVSNKAIGGQIGLDILKNLNLSSDSYNPFVNGYYYIHMQNGTWINYFDNRGKFNDNNVINISTTTLKNVSSLSGKYIFNTDLPNILMETEMVSGRLRNINYATKMQIVSDFSISYHDTNNLDLFSYNVAWFKFIEALRRGDVPLREDDWTRDEAQAGIETFIKIPYYNAIWVLIFKPFSTIPIGIFKVMGVTPINLPIQQLVGDRGSPTIGNFTQNFKCNDVIFDFIGEDKFAGYEENITNNSNSTYNILLSEFTKVFNGKK